MTIDYRPTIWLPSLQFEFSQLMTDELELNVKVGRVEILILSLDGHSEQIAHANKKKKSDL